MAGGDCLQLRSPPGAEITCDVSRVLGTRAAPAQVTERMVTLCQTLCQLEPGTLSSPMDKGSFSAHLCAECVGDPGAEHVWDGHRYTCSAHHRWVAPGPSPKRPSTYTPHPPGEWTAHRVPPEVVEADLQIADLYSNGSPHGWSRRWYAEWGPPVGQSTTV